MSAPGNISVLLLPGMDGTGELLTALVDQLSLLRFAQIISFPANRSLGYDDLIAFVAERTPKGRFAILGESFSGPIAIEIAATESRVAGLILASSFAWHPIPSLFVPLVQMLDMKWVPGRIVQAALLGSTGTPELRAHLCRVLERLPREIIRARASEVLRVDKRNRLRQINCPMLCLHGRFDRLVGKKCVDEITLVKPRCQVQWFDASHMLLETHTDAAAEAVNEFCNGLASDAC